MFLLILAYSHNSFSQFQVKGIAQASNGEALPFANVLLLNQKDSSLFKGTVSNEAGKFVLENIKQGNYLLSIRMIGYERFFTFIEVKAQNLNVGVLKLNALSKELKEVTVTAQKPLYEQQIDRLVINIASSITLAGSTALEILERSPGVIVNQQSNTLGLNGKNGVILMINGKINRLPMEAVIQLLKGMNAANIEKIELISNPPAKYDAEGNAGMINLILKKGIEEGTNGSFSLSGGYSRGEKADASLNLNHRSKKLNIFGDYSFSRNHTAQEFSGDRRVDYQGQTIETITKNVRDPRINYHSAKLGFDYAISPKTVIGGLISGYSSQWKIDALADISLKKSREADTSIVMSNSEVNHWQNVSANLNLNHQIDSTQVINFDIDYLYYHDNNPTDYQANYYGEQGTLLRRDFFRTRKVTPIRTTVGKVDYIKNFGKTRLEIGAKVSLYRFVNEISIENLQKDFWRTDPSMSGKYDLAEDILAAYSSMHFQINAKTKLNAGLRYEHTRTNLNLAEVGNILDRNYGNLFPSLFLSREINKNNSLQFAFSRRITRPTIRDLAPFMIFSDPYSFISGNSALLPTLTYSFKTEYRHKDLIFALQYSHDDNLIAFAQSHVNPATNRMLSYSVNIKSQDTYSLVLALPITVTKWWTMQNNLNASQQILEANHLEKPVKVRQFNMQFNSAQNFRLTNYFSLEISGSYNTPSFWGLNQLQPFGALNLGLQKKLNNDKGTFSFTVSDIFWTNNWRFRTYAPEQNLDASTSLIFSEPRLCRLTYSRNFGNSKLKRSRDRVLGSDEERRRVGN
jgi:hypothetical protein